MTVPNQDLSSLLVQLAQWYEVNSLPAQVYSHILPDLTSLFEYIYLLSNVLVHRSYRCNYCFVAVAQLFYAVWKYISKDKCFAVIIYLLMFFFFKKKIAGSTAALPLYTIESSPQPELLLEEGWRPQSGMSYYVV
jgi:hypothetical protein